MLENAIKKYQNNLLTTEQVIKELIRLAKGIYGLTDSEIAFV